jgi:hypothetical protein
VTGQRPPLRSIYSVFSEDTIISFVNLQNITQLVLLATVARITFIISPFPVVVLRTHVLSHEANMSGVAVHRCIKYPSTRTSVIYLLQLSHYYIIKVTANEFSRVRLDPLLVPVEMC